MQKFLIGAMAALGVAGQALAALPAPSDEAKAKAAEAAARAAHAGKVGGYQLCTSMDRVAARYAAEARAKGVTVTPVATPPCADPGPFVAAPPASAKP